MQVYFSHSYRDVSVNSYFLEHFVNEDLSLLADQKTDVWCVAKLERYLSEIVGFVSIIPRRPTADDPVGYSPYIGRELDLARRARVTRLLFVDEQVLDHHKDDFPDDAVGFPSDSPAEFESIHRDAIQKFRTTLETRARRRRRPEKPTLPARPKATLVVGEGPGLRSVMSDVNEILIKNKFNVTIRSKGFQDRGLDDIKLLETLRRSELCVFLLGEQLSDAHLALAMAHADCIPSIRLQFNERSAEVKTNPTLGGVFHWSTAETMLEQLNEQVKSFKEGLIQPVAMAQQSNALEATQKISTMQWRGRADNLWKPDDYPGLLLHVSPEHVFVQDEVDRVKHEIKKPFGQVRDRTMSMEICHSLYRGFARHRFGYEIEPQIGTTNVQKIRTPSQIETHRTATCLDLACLFAASLEAAQQRPVIALLRGPEFRHAIPGYIPLSEPAWENPTIGDLRRAVSSGDAVFFEGTGAVEADGPVAAETPEDRANKIMDFSAARAAAVELIKRENTELEYLLDVRNARV